MMVLSMGRRFIWLLMRGRSHSFNAKPQNDSKFFKELYGKVNPKTERLIQHMIPIRLKSDGVEANMSVNPEE